MQYMLDAYILKAMKAIIFDFFDVISPDVFKAWLADNGFERAGPFAEASELLDRGAINEEGFFERLALASGQDVSVLASDFHAMATMDKTLVTYIAELKKSHKVGLLSNAASAHIRNILDVNDLERLFDGIAISSEIGHAKPSAEAFTHALSLLGTLPEDTVFVDDNPAHIRGAVELGIHGVLYTDLDQLKRELACLRQM